MHSTSQEVYIEVVIGFEGISKLVLSGRIGEAVEATRRAYPGLLERDLELLFLLKCRQFVEMVNGTDSEVTFLCLFLFLFNDSDNYLATLPRQALSISLHY